VNADVVDDELAAGDGEVCVPALDDALATDDAPPPLPPHATSAVSQKAVRETSSTRGTSTSLLGRPHGTVCMKYRPETDRPRGA
jgi:hypothetical protein